MLRIAIIACFWNWNNHSTSTHVIRIEIWAPGQNIFALQFPRQSSKFWKIADSKSAISPLLELQMRWFVFWNYVFLKEEFIYAACFFWFCAQSFRNLSKGHRPILPSFFSWKEKKNSHLCQGKCSDTRCEEPLAITMKIQKYWSTKDNLSIVGHFEGATSFEQAQYKITLRCFHYPQQILIY